MKDLGFRVRGGGFSLKGSGFKGKDSRYNLEFRA